MSDRLAIASAFSVLAMTAYVLFGADAARAPLAAETMDSPLTISVPAELPSLDLLLRSR